MTLRSAIITGTASININGTVGATTPSTGAFTTLSATGTITSSSNHPFTSPTSGTSYNYIDLNNTGGQLLLGLDSSGGGIFSTGTPYGGFLNSPTTFIIQVAGSTKASFSSTGLAVTGTLSATGTLSGGTSGTGYSFSGSAAASSLTLDASGNLLVGTTSPIFSGRQTISYNGASYNGLVLSESANTSSATFLAFNNGATNIGSVARVAATSTVVYNTISDYRLKTIVGAVTGQGERIDALKPIDYKWTEGGQNARGFLAHEFQEIYENSVTGSKDAVDKDGNPIYQGMQAGTAEVIADLVAELQSLRKRITALETK